MEAKVTQPNPQQSYTFDNVYYLKMKRKNFCFIITNFLKSINQVLGKIKTNSFMHILTQVNEPLLKHCMRFLFCNMSEVDFNLEN